MIVLFDYDSMIYKSSYRIVSFSEIREFIVSKVSRDIIEEEIVNRSIDRMQNMEQKIFEEIEQTGVSIDSVEYYITTAKNSIRKQICKRYKANRKSNKWVKKIKEKIISDYTNLFYSDEWEADDLIADRAKEQGEFIICSLDKDLQQIEGIHYNYYKDRETNEAKGLSIVGKFESIYTLYFQMLAGDSGDNIVGIKSIGKEKAKKLLDGCKTEYSLKNRVCRAYLHHYKDRAKEELIKHFRLLKLGTYN